MSNVFKNTALLENIAGVDHPPVALNIAARYQFCVDAGVAAAVGFFDNLTETGLHDHIAASMHSFLSVVRVPHAGGADAPALPHQSCADAFAAGYLGRIQQELRLFHNDRGALPVQRARSVH